MIHTIGRDAWLQKHLRVPLSVGMYAYPNSAIDIVRCQKGLDATPIPIHFQYSHCIADADRPLRLHVTIQ